MLNMLNIFIMNKMNRSVWNDDSLPHVFAFAEYGNLIVEILA